jgi:hypothetical protein
MKPTAGYYVLIVGHAREHVNGDAYDAMKYARERVYIGAQQFNVGLRALRDGKPFSYAYGFSEAHIEPVAEGAQ